LPAPSRSVDVETWWRSPFGNCQDDCAGHFSQAALDSCVSASVRPQQLGRSQSSLTAANQAIDMPIPAACRLNLTLYFICLFLFASLSIRFRSTLDAHQCELVAQLLCVAL
jgi:hypothetical protein